MHTEITVLILVVCIVMLSSLSVLEISQMLQKESFIFITFYHCLCCFITFHKIAHPLDFFLLLSKRLNLKILNISMQILALVEYVYLLLVLSYLKVIYYFFFFRNFLHWFELIFPFNLLRAWPFSQIKIDLNIFCDYLHMYIIAHRHMST